MRRILPAILGVLLFLSPLCGQCELSKLIAPDRGPDQFFGNMVAISGDYAVMGAVRNPGSRDEAGAAYVFLRQGAEWVFNARLVAEDGQDLDFYGLGSAIDGNIIVVGAVNHDAVEDDAGAVYVYRRSLQAWFEETKLTASDAAEDDNFGISVGVSGDTIIVGAPKNGGAAIDAGAAYIYRFQGGEWIETQKLTASDAAADDRFGWTVVINGDLAIVSAVLDDDNGSASGSAYIFRLLGDTWTEEAKLIASDGLPANWFSFSLWIDDDVAVCGAHFANFDTGKVYVFRNQGGGNWTEEKILEASDAEAGDHFGLAVTVEGDRILVGARRDDDNGFDSGSAYLFERQGTEWVEVAKMISSDGETQDHFGRAVALDGGYALIGAYQDDAKAGAAYMFYVDDLPDCDGNGEADPCQIVAGSPDCNLNGVPDSCDISAGTSEDMDGNGIPDECEGPLLIRGDVDGNGALLLNDAILILGYLFSMGAVPCLDAADFDDDGQVLVNDAILHLGYLFSQGPPPLPPFPDCGADLTPDAGGGDQGCAGPCP